MSGKGRISGINPARLSTALHYSQRGLSDQQEAGMTKQMASEALQLSQSTADAVQELRIEMQHMRADIIKNAEEFTTFMTAAMGTLQALSQGAAPAPLVPPSPAPTVPLSPAPTVPLSPELTALPAPGKMATSVPDGAIGATAESQPLMPVRNVRRKRRHLGARTCGQETLQEPSCLSAGAIKDEEPADPPLNLEDILEGVDASGANNVNVAQKRHMCEECGKTFTAKSSLKVHMRSIHAGERPYPCDECDMAFKSKGDLIKHMRKHTGERPFKCEECGKAFTSKPNLNAHMRKHTGERPYKCEECGNTFIRKDTLKLHVRSIHAGERPHKCRECGDTFKQTAHLTGHMRTKHTR